MAIQNHTNFDWITIIETNSFIRESRKLFDEVEINNLKSDLASYPALGDVIPGLKGIRKMRWQAQEKGTRGGARIIYFFYNEHLPLFLLDVYSKSKKQDLTSDEKKILNRFVDEILEHYGE